jgi:hypothetical protein
MGEDDGIIVKQDGDDVHLSDTETDAEYVIQLGESEDIEDVMAYEMSEGDILVEDDMLEGDEAYEEEEVVYEIEIGDEEEVSEEWDEEEMSEGWGGKKGDDSKSHKDYETNEEEDEEEEGEIEETQAHSNNIGRRQIVKPSNYPKNLERPAVRESVKNEIKQLREKNEEYRKALNIFKEKLNEVAVFNSNLAYATRLFTEHSTTKQEKINILRRFDGVETLKESKSLYKTIKEDLGGKETNVVTESVQSKVTKTPTKGSANNLIESKTYENPQFLRMRDLMNKLK